MGSDGTVRDRKSRYGINDRYAGTTVVNVIPSDTYWSMTVLREIANYI